jgi:hypothetical protein
MILTTLVTVHLVLFTGPDGQMIEVNPQTVTSLRTVRTIHGSEHFAKGINCNIFTTDGKNIAVTETCAEVHDKLQQAKENGK